MFVIVLLGACSGGDTEVQGGGTAPAGPTATGPTAAGPTGETSTGAFDGAVSLDLSARQNPTGAAMYEGVPIGLAQFFRKVALPIVSGAPRC